MGTIYILKNKINGKIYVGKTSRPFNTRFREHCQSRSLIGNALRKYGANSFEKVIIENISEEQLDKNEINYIKEYNSISPHGYNLMHGGEGGKHSKESKQKMSISQKERFENEPSPRKGVHLTDETKQKLSEARKGKFTGEDNPFYGKHHTEETNQINREAHLGKPSAFKGKHHTDETKQKLSESHLGKPSQFKGRSHTEEAKQKNRKAHLGKGGETQKHNNEIFIENAILVHGNKYDYSKVDYKNTDTKVIIICSKHGEFLQSPYKHTKRKQGCPICGKEISRLKTIERNKSVKIT